MNDQDLHASRIDIESIVSGRTFEPMVQLTWGDQSGQLTPGEARRHALSILEAADAAESDAFVFRWLTRDIIGNADDERENWKTVMEQFKAFRLARRSE